MTPAKKLRPAKPVRPLRRPSPPPQRPAIAPKPITDAEMNAAVENTDLSDLLNGPPAADPPCDGVIAQCERILNGTNSQVHRMAAERLQAIASELEAEEDEGELISTFNDRIWDAIDQGEPSINERRARINAALVAVGANPIEW